MELAEILTLIGDYGVTIVCSAILIIMFVRLTLNQEKMIKKLFDKFQRESDTRHPSPEESANIDEINEVIRGLLHKIQNKLSSDRAYLFLFHNGGKSLSGLSFQKMSCVNEVVSPGIAPCSKTSQLLQRGNYLSISNALKEKGYYDMELLADLETTDPYIYFFFKDRHTESAYLVPLEDSDGYIIGFIGVDYCSVNKTLNKETILNTLKEFSFRVSSLVDIKDKNN